MHPVEVALLALADAEHAVTLQRYFQTGPGQYGEGDQFLGVRVPVVRQCLRPHHRGLQLEDVASLLASSWHEVRLAGAIAAGEVYRRREAERDDLLSYLLASIDRLNNWDLIDTCAPHTMGQRLIEAPDAVEQLLPLIVSPSLWERRFAVISTLAPARQGSVELAYRFLVPALEDDHDLIHKAGGWVLREAQPHDPQRFTRFLDQWAPRMPRVMLRYALEKQDAGVRRHYLALPRE